MSEYEDFRVTIELRSPLGTPLQSDTLFGHLAWQVRYAEGEEGVRRFLEEFAEWPPFVFSDGFPAGLLPRPLLSVPAPAGDTREEYAEARRRRKARFVPVEDFLGLLRGERPPGEPVSEPWRTVRVPHAPINRRTGTVGSAPGFYHARGRVPERGAEVHLYLRTLPDWKERVLGLLAALAAVGYGRRKSSGWGEFRVKDCRRWEGFAPAGRTDGFVSLSSYAPAGGDPTDGRWRLRLKHGKLGENAGQGRPFKKPLIQFEPGAVFRCPGPVRPVYGRLIAGIAPGMPRVVQCGLTLAAPCRWEPAGD